MKLTLTSRECPICRSSDQSVVFVDANVDLSKLDDFAFASRKLPEYMHWRLLECRRCDLLYASPAPAAQSLGEAYDVAAFDSVGEARLAAISYGRLLPRITSKLGSLGAALDIGTGDGAFLGQLIDAGFDKVMGVEPSSAPIAAATPELRPLISHDVFRVSDYPAGSLDLITCFQTFEHLFDPLQMSRDAFSLLRPGGAVLFVGHNRRAISAHLLGTKSPIFDIEHLQLFSPISARRLVSTSGFANVEVGSVFNRYPINYWARLFPLSSTIKQRTIGLLNASRLGRLVLPLPAGNLFVIGYKPP